MTDTPNYPDSEDPYFYCFEGVDKNYGVRKTSGICHVPVNTDAIGLYEYILERHKSQIKNYKDYEWVLTALNKL